MKGKYTEKTAHGKEVAQAYFSPKRKPKFFRFLERDVWQVFLTLNYFQCFFFHCKYGFYSSHCNL